MYLIERHMQVSKDKPLMKIQRLKYKNETSFIDIILIRANPIARENKFNYLIFVDILQNTQSLNHLRLSMLFLYLCFHS